MILIVSFVRQFPGERGAHLEVPTDGIVARRGPLRLGSITLALFLNAGSIKDNPVLSGLPADLTLLLGVLLTVLLFVQISFMRFIPVGFWSPVFLVSLFSIGLLHPLISRYGYDKFMSFGTFTLLGMLAAVVFLSDERGRRVFLISLAWTGILGALLLAIFPTRTSDWGSVVTLAGTNTISTSRIILTAAIVVIIFAIFGRRKLGAVLFLLLLTILLVFAALFTGSRGPVIAAGIAIVTALLISTDLRRVRGRAIAIGLLLSTIGFFLVTRSDFGGLDRITAFLSGDSDTSTIARSTFWRISWEFLLGHPLGAGWGGFAGLDATRGYGVGDRIYPHNIFFEVAVEFGWVGLIVFVYFVVGSLIRLGKAADSASQVALFAVLVFTLVNAMVSGDINDNRLMWALLAVGWASSAWGAKLKAKSGSLAHGDS